MSDNPIELLLGSAQFKEQVEEQAEVRRKASERKPKYRSKNYLASLKRWQESHPLQVKAGLAVKYAVKTGKLVRGPCLINNKDCHGRSEAHHLHGYEKEHWLDVVWLCKYHHEIADTKEPKEKIR